MDRHLEVKAQAATLLTQIHEALQDPGTPGTPETRVSQDVGLGELVLVSHDHCKS